MDRDEDIERSQVIIVGAISFLLIFSFVSLSLLDSQHHKSITVTFNNTEMNSTEIQSNNILSQNELSNNEYNMIKSDINSSMIFITEVEKSDRTWYDKVGLGLYWGPSFDIYENKLSKYEYIHINEGIYKISTETQVNKLSSIAIIKLVPILLCFGLILTLCFIPSLYRSE